MTSSNGNIFRVTGPLWREFPSHRPVMRIFGVFFDLCLNKRLRKQSRRLWSETLSRSLWRLCNVDKWKGKSTNGIISTCQNAMKTGKFIDGCTIAVIQIVCAHWTRKQISHILVPHQNSVHRRMLCWTITWVIRSVKIYHLGSSDIHEDIMTFKRFPHYWPSAIGNHRLSVDSPHRCPVMRSLI